MPLLLLKNAVASASFAAEEVNGRTPIILNCEPVNASAAQHFNGYPRDNVSRRPPPYRDVPSCRKPSVRGGIVGSNGPRRAQSVPPRAPCPAGANRPKSLHQHQFSHLPPEPNVHLTVPPAYPHFTAFPQSVSLQFDALPDNWHERHPVPSPAPAERKQRPSRHVNVNVNVNVKTPRSSSVPRTLSFARSGRMRPLSHPTSLASSLASWTSSLTFQTSGSTPAPVPSPSSTPSPHPHDILRTQHGIRLLEEKLELYVDILTSQERFVQVSWFNSHSNDLLSPQKNIGTANQMKEQCDMKKKRKPRDGR